MKKDTWLLLLAGLALYYFTRPKGVTVPYYDSGDYCDQKSASYDIAHCYQVGRTPY